MDKRYRVSGIFNLVVEGEEVRDAKETVERILRNGGIDGKVVEVEGEQNGMA